MIRIEVIMAENDIAKVSEGLKKIGVGGLTVFKLKRTWQNSTSRYSCLIRHSNIYS